jgi:asparagine synthase (glutamine-hydrolysing)
MLATDLTNYLPGDLLVKMDRMTMANSLEARSPFLDQQFIEFTARLPEEMKRKGNVGKWLLKKTFSNLIPPEIIRRPKKGFAVPIDEWLRTSLKDMMADAIYSLPAPVNIWLDQSSIQTLFARHLNGKENHGELLWALLILHLWLKNFIQES